MTHDIDEALKVGDRIALLNVGGTLEQYATPDQLLRDPASGFVEEFVGADRSIKRLQLKVVSELPYNQGPVVPVATPLAEALGVMDRHASEWIGVTERDQFLGWIYASDLEHHTILADAPRALPAARVQPESTLRSAMQIIMTSHTSVAVVDDNGRFGGVVTLESIRAGLEQGGEDP